MREHRSHRIFEISAPQQRLEPVGYCIYCDKTTPEVALSDEHIIPDGLGGDIILPKASCRVCADSFTQVYETSLMKNLYRDIRGTLGFKSRKKRPKDLQRIVLGKGVTKKSIDQPYDPDSPWMFATVELNSLPTAFYAPWPGTEYGYRNIDLIMSPSMEKMRDGSQLSVMLDISKFFRAIAKIAFSYAVAEYGYQSFIPIIKPYILGENTPSATYYTGSYRSVSEECHHSVSSYIEERVIYGPHGPYMTEAVIVDVRLFATVPGHTYHLVVGVLS